MKKSKSSGQQQKRAAGSPSKRVGASAIARPLSGASASTSGSGKQSDYSQFDLINPALFQSSTLKQLLIGSSGGNAQHYDIFGSSIGSFGLTDNSTGASPSLGGSDPKTSTLVSFKSTALDAPHSPHRYALEEPPKHKIDFKKSAPKSAHSNSSTVLYSAHFSGLESIGASGMTILEELIDIAFKTCENGRASGLKHHARGSALLSSTGKVYSGCDILINRNTASTTTISVTAERSSILAAVADGSKGFDCIVIASDTMKAFPSPDGASREFLRNFGEFPIILVNCDLEIKRTSTQELFPLNPAVEKAGMNADGSYADSNTLALSTDKPSEENEFASDDIALWSSNDVAEWLTKSGLSDIKISIIHHKVDGKLLLQIDEYFAFNTLGIQNAITRRKLIRGVVNLKEKYVLKLKEKTLDELDEYVMLLENHRIKLIAKLKAIFDRFDQTGSGKLSGIAVENVLLYMNRPIDSVQVNLWINKLKDEGLSVDFIEFVTKYSYLFANEDPDLGSEQAYTAHGISPTKEKQAKNVDKKQSSEGEEKWDTREGDSKTRDNDNTNTSSSSNNNNNNDAQLAVSNSSANKDVLDVRVLAELKAIFDRFAIDGLITTPECCQALSEAGLAIPRREIAQYMRARSFASGQRNVSFFEFIRAFAYLRSRIEDLIRSKTSKGYMKITGGDVVECRYRARGNWQRGKVIHVNSNDTVDVEYEDGEVDASIPMSEVKMVNLVKFQEQDNVESNFGSKRSWQDGTIIRPILSSWSTRRLAAAFLGCRW